MLIYDPALDPYHSSVRILAIASSSAEANIELALDAARIIDYFLVYPSKLLNFRLPKEHRVIRTDAKAHENPYRHAIGMRTSFERIRPVFFAALNGLVAAKLIDFDAMKRGILRLSEQGLPEDLAVAVSRFRTRQSPVGKFILSTMITIPVNGIDGLKHRSSLLEHRYDTV